MKTVLITGATGFLGANIVHALIKEGYIVFATFRSKSDLSRCIDIQDKINWINVEEPKWENSCKINKIDVLIHSAWAGVTINDRYNWDLQLSNFIFSRSVFQFAHKKGVEKIIALGSQSEYGIIYKKVNENDSPKPIDAYGAVKLLTQHYLSTYANMYQIDWYWLRVFSIFGKYENENWIIPSVIKQLVDRKSINLTKGEQKYDYMYIDDFITNFMKVVKYENRNPGIFNICTGIETEIRTILLRISNLINGTSELLKFGTIPYRKDQNMYMVGSNSKFESVFGKITLTKIDENLKKTIDYHMGR